jgi:hypothetical protein
VGEVYLAGPKNEYGDFELDTILSNEKQCYALGRRAYLHDLCVVLMLSEMDDAVRKLFIGAYLTGMFEAASNPMTRRPHWIALEEIHEYAPQVGLSKDDPLRLTILRVAKRGRKRGMFLIPMSQRPANIPPTTASPSETPGEVHVDRFVRATEAEGLQREVDAIEDREGTSVVATAYLRELEEAIPRMRAAIETATGHQRNLETRIAELEVAVPKEGESADLYARNVELTRKLAGAIQARNDAEKRAGPITLLMDLIKEANKEE